MHHWQGFLRNDNSSTMELLTAYASAFAAEGELEARAVDQLKSQLNLLTQQLSSTEESLVKILAKDSSEFLQVLLARYGHHGFVRNHFRFTCGLLLSESCLRLSSWADLVLKKAELFLNRPFLATYGTNEQRRELYPAVLLQFANVLHETALSLKHTRLKFSAMRPADILDTSSRLLEVENKIAITAGFSGLEEEPLSFCRVESQGLRNIGTTMSELGASLLELTEGLRKNSAPSEGARQFCNLMEDFSTNCQRLSGHKFQFSESMESAESRRLSFLFEVFKLNEQISELASLFKDFLTPGESLRPEELLTADVERALICSMLKGGTDIGLAKTAAKDLFQYCLSHQATPHSLIAAELKKINPHLREDTLKLAADLTINTVTSTPGGSAEKSRFLDSMKKLRKQLNVTAPFSAPLAVIFITLLNFGCGVKTQPMSEVPDPRPEIPFHDTQSLPSPPDEPVTPKKAKALHDTK